MDRLLGSEAHAEPALDSATLASVLGEIAETVAATLELQEVIEQVAHSMRRVIPLDVLGVIRAVGKERWALHAAAFEPYETRPSPPLFLADWSPRVRPGPLPLAPVDDAQVELDPAFVGDRGILERGLRSLLWEPFRRGGAFAGGVMIGARAPHAFTAAHAEALRPIAALLGSAVEHWRLWELERRRHERLERLESLLGTLAAALDVSAVFDRLAAAVQEILPHDVLGLTAIDPAARTLRVLAVAGEHNAALPRGPIQLTEQDLAADSELALYADISAELPPSGERNRTLRSTGMRSLLLVPVLLEGEVRGGLTFLHREPARYGPDDVELAVRLADRVALMFSHQRLAEEARLAAESTERAERLEATVETLLHELAARGRGRVGGTSSAWREVLKRVGQVARAETTVLITGESGTGKEVVAHLIHERSPRAARPFVAINCAALPEQLLESELFGHEKGAFTGALQSRMGRVEQAAGGTLFLDEIGEMSPLLQAKLLRVLQEREFQRVGGLRTLRADARVLAATNRDLREAMARGTFREDLYYRLNVFEIRVPPLRERREDILALAQLFLEDLGRSIGRPAAGISREARDWLESYSWPGNVRELRNAIERAILLCDGGLIARQHLALAPASPNPSGDGVAVTLPPDGIDLEAVERAYIEQALTRAYHNRSRAARLLGLTRAQLYSRLDKYGLR